MKGTEGTECVVSDYSAPVVVCQLKAPLAETLASIELESNTPAWSVDAFSSEFENEHARIFGVRTNSEVVAFIVSHIVFDDAHIVKFGVRERYRNQGIGTTLLSAALHDLNSLGARAVTLEVRRNNLVARNLYSKFGFIEISVRERYCSDNGEDALVMKLSMLDFVAQHEAA